MGVNSKTGPRRSPFARDYIILDPLGLRQTTPEYSEDCMLVLNFCNRRLSIYEDKSITMSALKESVMKILISTIFQDAGEATRALRMAGIIRRYAPVDKPVDIAFVSRGGGFNQLAEDSGFRIISAKPHITHANFHDEFHTAFGDQIGDLQVAKALLQGEIEVYKRESPDVIVNGFFPVSTIARRMACSSAIGISFLPLPLVRRFTQEVTRFPEESALSRLPESLQRAIMRCIPTKAKCANPALRHRTLARAAYEMGCSEKLDNIFDMLSSRCYLINDYSIFYDADSYGENVVFTGPLIPQTTESSISDPGVLKALSLSNHRKKVFCSLGSVGSKELLQEIVAMLNSPQGLDLGGVIRVPKETCDLAEAKRMLHNCHMYMTDSFLPARHLCRQVDAVICHGGQGTLQTAIQGGAPVIGVAMQPEQEINLQHLADFGAAIKISRRHWNAVNIGKAVDRVLSEPGFRIQSRKLELIAENTDTEKIIGTRFWKVAGDPKRV
jgi:UDP:flavonoid glycosyltransferase YjiC (YdhE family)